MPLLRAGAKPSSLTVLVSAAALLAGCGGAVEFTGKAPVAVMGELPPPPPPPPPPEKPPEPPPKVIVKDNKIEITEKIQFEVAKAVILPQSFDLLNEIADTIKKNPHIKKIAIEGHASAEGDAKRNLKLSDERAKSVMAYLVEKGGIPATTFTAKGYGSSKPIATNDDEEGREKNRRVEFNIIEQDVTKKKVEVDTKTGKETVLEEKTSAVKKDLPPAPTDAAKEPPKKGAIKKAAPKEEPAK